MAQNGVIEWWKMKDMVAFQVINYSQMLFLGLYNNFYNKLYY